MHPMSYLEMSKLIAKYCINWGKEHTVYDIGACDVNGTYKPLLEHCTYIGVDIEAGKNVDIVMVDEFNTGIASNSADLVVSGQCYEHCNNPFKLTREIYRITKKGGLFFLIAPFVFGEHKFPIDCFRYLPDGYKSLHFDAGFTTLEAFLTGVDNIGSVDCVGAAIK